MATDRRRALQAIFFGALTHAIIALTLLFLGTSSGDPVLGMAAWFVFAGLPLWPVLGMIFHENELAERERREAARLEKQVDESIFGNSAEDLSLAHRRLRRLERFGLPLVSLIIAAYWIAVGGWLAPAYDGSIPPPVAPLALTFIAGAFSFMALLVSKYLTGMARHGSWQLLRGAGGFLTALMILCILLAVGYGARHAGSDKVAEYTIPILRGFALLLGIEIAITLVLEIYRPRRAGETPRPAFDSRILEYLGHPEHIGQSFRSAVNYQFGFEITHSWFWRFLGKAIGPLVAFAVAVLLFISCIVIVEPHQQAVILSFGKLVNTRPLEPGLHFKRPWPLQSAEVYEVQSIREVAVGSITKLADDVPLLWTNQHAVDQEEPFIVRPAELPGARKGQGEDDDTPSVSLVATDIFVQYRIDDLLSYLRTNADVEERLIAISQGEVSRYLATRDIDFLLGAGRSEAGGLLQDRIQQGAEKARLGLAVLSVSVGMIHPPQPVSESFHRVVGAQQDRATLMEQARQEAISILTEVAGTREKALQLVAAIDALATMRESRDDADAEVREAELGVEMLVAAAGGKASQVLSEGRSQAWRQVSTERGLLRRFQTEMKAYEKAPLYYKVRIYLDMLTRGLARKGLPKIILLGRREQMLLDVDLGGSPSEFLNPFTGSETSRATPKD